ALAACDAASGNGALNVTVTGNTVSDPGQFATNGINLNGGTNTGNANPICLDIRGNSITGSGLNANPGEGPGLSPRFLGETGGSETVTLLETQMPAHTHALRAHAADEADISVPSPNVS